MERQSRKRASCYKSKAKLLEDSVPYEIAKVVPAQECYVDRETLVGNSLAMFTGSFKTPQEDIWTVTLFPEEFSRMQSHPDIMEVYAKLGLSAFFSLPAWGTDIKRCHQLLDTLQDDGEAIIDGPGGEALTVKITEEDVSTALFVPRGNISLTGKSTPEEINETFLQLKGGDFTFRDLVRREMEVPLRFYT